MQRSPLTSLHSLSDPAVVLVVMPVLNEAMHIERTVRAILDSKYPAEFLSMAVMDGGSSDGTTAIVERLRREYGDRLHSLDNPGANKSAGLNNAIRSIPSEVVIRVDAHAVYPDGYVSELVSALQDLEVENVGGVRATHLPNGSLAGALARMVSHPFAAGNATYRVGTSAMVAVDSVFGGCYPREIFERIGYFDERLLRAQDREFNDRLRRAGGTIIILPHVRVEYHARTKLRPFLSWITDGGDWVFRSGFIVGRPLWSWRNVVPAMFACYLLAGSAVLIKGVNRPLAVVTTFPMAVYGCMDLFATISCAIRAKRAGMLHLVWLFPVGHLAYAFGSFRALADRGRGAVHALVLPARKSRIGYLTTREDR
jgi:succinoglycan biosynthesis protein ExoA